LIALKLKYYTALLSSPLSHNVAVINVTELDAS